MTLTFNLCRAEIPDLRSAVVLLGRQQAEDASGAGRIHSAHHHRVSPIRAERADHRLRGASRHRLRSSVSVRRVCDANAALNPQVCISGEWQSWQGKVPQIEVETHKVASPDVVVPTLDTVRHEALLYTWLAEHKPLVLCGPPGSGKTMTLFSALRALPDMEVRSGHFNTDIL